MPACFSASSERKSVPQHQRRCRRKPRAEVSRRPWPRSRRGLLWVIQVRRPDYAAAPERRQERNQRTQATASPDSQILKAPRSHDPFGLLHRICRVAQTALFRRLHTVGSDCIPFRRRQLRVCRRNVKPGPRRSGTTRPGNPNRIAETGCCRRAFSGTKACPSVPI